MPIGNVVVPLLYGADVAGIADSMGEDSYGAPEVAGPAPTVTVTVLADVTVTVSGPHSPPEPAEPPIGELPKALLAGKSPVSDSLPLSETGTGTTVTVESGMGLGEPAAVPVPVGPGNVELPRS